MATDQKFQSFCDKNILRKKWERIRDNWAPYLESAKNLNLDDDDYTQLPQIFSEVASIYSAEELGTKFVEAEYVRPFLLKESITLLRKASNVISNAQSGVLKGYKTWSLVNAYHGAHFAAKSILSFFGYTFPVVTNPSGISHLAFIDVWPTLTIGSGRSKKVTFEVDKFIRLSKPPVAKIEQRHIWMTLLRLLNTCSVEDVWPKKYTKVIRTIDFKEFGRQRNHLFYDNNAWLFDDLITFIVTPNWGIILEDFYDDYRRAIKDMDSDFSILISMVLLKMAYLLLEDTCKYSTILNDSLNDIQSVLQSTEWHPLYIQSAF
ncbi:MAG TPA: hypothetical protein VHE34_08745 [Puia sp.]|uniref:hypothetical protein n=1 Tax=Puia sp. TaxID=2045100 RepID=UPI002BDCC90B|nr:hypothetical protein [Puia sp.]HVU95298.1 hypothetical protein [Puia sp.]